MRGLLADAPTFTGREVHALLDHLIQSGQRSINTALRMGIVLGFTFGAAIGVILTKALS